MHHFAYVSWTAVSLLSVVACSSIIGADFGSYHLAGADASMGGPDSGSGGSENAGASSNGGHGTGGASGSGGTSPSGGSGSGSGGPSSSGGTLGAGGSSPSSRKRVFVTGATFDGDLRGLSGLDDGVDGADSLCNASATQAGLGGTWTAFISGKQANGIVANAVDRIPDVGPWYLVDQATLVFDSKDTFTTPHHAIAMTETGAAPDQSVSYLAWTGSFSDGTAYTNRCNDWTAGVGSSTLGTCGLPASATTTWMSDADQYCTGPGRLYCFETTGGTVPGNGGASTGGAASSGGTGGTIGTGGTAETDGAVATGGVSGIADGGACVASKCPSCGATLGAACCVNSTKCGCPIFYIPGSCH